MKTKQPISKQPLVEQKDPSPFIRWNYKYNEDTGEEEFESIELSDNTPLNDETLKTAVKNAAGTSDLAVGDKLLNKVARGMSMDNKATRLNEVSALLPSLYPNDPTEALLLGQFLALQDSGLKCLRLANLPEQGFYHIERLFGLANKLLNTANQTMQAVLKYRTRGQQTVQVVHVHNEGQAIVAQNLSPTTGGHVEKNEN
ncbi:MAG: hypothetical protein KDK55_04295 [Chlamydiia bacterium]|nr:hypothetical protein [Chlamydiia bacterium]